MSRYCSSSVPEHPITSFCRKGSSSAMSEHRAKLVRALTIPRAEDNRPSSGRARWGASAVACFVPALPPGGGTAWYAAPLIPLKGQGGEVPSSQPSPAPPAPPVSEPRRAGSLAASGYVVARRKSTIAAEITGKVVEVFTDEGNVVEAGQIVARLDSVLAEKDLALSQSRADAADAAVGAIAAGLQE